MPGTQASRISVGSSNVLCSFGLNETDITARPETTAETPRILMIRVCDRASLPAIKYSGSNPAAPCARRDYEAPGGTSRAPRASSVPSARACAAEN